MKTVLLHSFAFSNDVGGTVLIDDLRVKAEIVESWDDYEIGRRYIGVVSDPTTVGILKQRGLTGFSTSKEAYIPQRVYFGKSDISKSLKEAR